MKMNKEELKRFAELSDKDLWGEVRALAKKHGITLKDEMPSHEELMKMRRAMLGIEKINLSDARRLISEYKRRDR